MLCSVATSRGDPATPLAAGLSSSLRAGATALPGAGPPSAGSAVRVTVRLAGTLTGKGSAGALGLAMSGHVSNQARLRVSAMSGAGLERQRWNFMAGWELLYLHVRIPPAKRINARQG